MSNADRVYKYMQDFGSITTFEAFRDLGITRLSAYIYILIHRGVDIHSDYISIINRYGKMIRCKRYRITEEKNNDT